MNSEYVNQWFEYILDNPYMAYQIVTCGNIVPVEFAEALEAILAFVEDDIN